MEDKMLKIAFIVAIIGMVALFILNQDIDNDEMISDQIDSVMGVVDSVRISGDTTFITLSAKQKIEVIVFSSLNISDGDNIEVVGKMEDKNIIADKLRIIG
jgi:hypothetical protein